jgi:acetyl-CoA carboxylase carboxyltransferase component
MPGSVVSVEVAVGAVVRRGDALAVIESMKMHHVIDAQMSGTIAAIASEPGAALAEGDAIIFVVPDGEDDDEVAAVAEVNLDSPRADLDEVMARHALGLDENRPEAVAKRRKVGGRTARENVDDLCDEGSFVEYGALAIAAQRRRRTLEDLMQRTPADGMLAGIGTVNGDHFGAQAARCAVLAYDYTVLAGTQGHVNHKKKDRLFELAMEWKLPVVFFCEGGGGRPGDVDTDDLIMSWLDIPTFTNWPRLSGVAPRIAVNFGRCFAGNAVIFGSADITVATRNSNIGLAGPAMIEGGGLGRFTPEEIGPIDVQTANGVVDLACEDEREATALTRQLLGYFQGAVSEWRAGDQRRLRHLIPENRLRVYDVRTVIEALADEGSVIELRRDYGVGLVTAFVRIEGQPFGLIANDPRHLGGAIDAAGGEKGGRFLRLCDAYGVPVVSLCDTPGFMVGPESEKTAAVRRGSRLIVASANLSVPLFTVVLRKAYGLGAQAMAGGGMHEPFFSIAWPTAEFGPMGLEGAVELGFRKELDAITDAAERAALYDKLVAQMYEKGKGVSVAQTFEIDAVIDPAQTRQWLLRGWRATAAVKRTPRSYVDVW